MLPHIDTVPGALPVVELGVGDTRIPVGQARWDVQRWDAVDALWAGQEPTWLDVSCDVNEITVETGRQRSTDRWQVGTVDVTVRNADGWADPARTPPPPPGVLTVRPGRQLRIGMAVDGAPVRWLWRGYLDATDPTYGPVTATDTVAFAGIDALGMAGKAILARLAAPSFAGDTATVRLNRILDAAQWRATMRQIAPTSQTVQATEYGTSVVDELGVTADSVGGAIFGDEAGRVVFKPRDWQTFDPAVPVDATVGNIGSPEVTDVCPESWEMTFRGEDFATVVHVGRPDDAPPVVAVDDTALILYGIEPFERTDLIMESDALRQTLAERYLATRAAATMPRVHAVNLNAARLPARDLVALVDPAKPSRYRCRFARAGRVVFDRQMLATGVRHTITPQAWTVRIALDDAAPYAAVGGRWDQAGWDQALWADVVVLLEELLGELQAVPT